jgi:hypothetical protein
VKVTGFHLHDNHLVECFNWGWNVVVVAIAVAKPPDSLPPEYSVKETTIFAAIPPGIDGSSVRQRKRVVISSRQVNHLLPTKQVHLRRDLNVITLMSELVVVIIAPGIYLVVVRDSSRVVWPRCHFYELVRKVLSCSAESDACILCHRILARDTTSKLDSFRYVARVLVVVTERGVVGVTPGV